MDQTDFSLLVGLLVGSHAGAFAVHSITGWSLWISYLTGGVLGLILFAAATFLLVQFVFRLMNRNRPP
jgi:hypothetical protein